MSRFMKSIIFNNRGVALILVILMVSVIVALTLDFNRSSRSGMYDTANLSDGIRLYYIAKSGFNGGEALLMADRNNFDALTEDWAKAELLSYQSEAFFRQGAFRIRIEDETGKIPINKLVNGNAYNPQIKEMLVRLLSLPEFNLDQNKVNEIVDSIKDWIDKDDEVTGMGAESSYYNSLEKPYACKNGLLDCIDELLMIKGITKKLYQGTKEIPGLKDCLTIYGDGKININTAPMLVLRALSNEISVEIAEKMQQYRMAEGNDLTDVNWYVKIPGLSAGSIISGLIAVKSNYFTITSTGILGNMKESVAGAVKKEQEIQTPRLLSWKVE
jgi:general secretion pathway protein K